MPPGIGYPTNPFNPGAPSIFPANSGFGLGVYGFNPSTGMKNVVTPTAPAATPLPTGQGGATGGLSAAGAPTGVSAGPGASPQIPPNLLPNTAPGVAAGTLTQQYAAYQQWAAANGQQVMPYQTWAQYASNPANTPLPPASTAPGAAPPAYNSQEYFQNAQLPSWQAAFPFIRQNPNAVFEAGDRSNFMDALAPDFPGGPFGLSGKPADQTAALVAQLLLGLTGQQAGRSGESEGMLRDMAFRSADSQPNQLARLLATQGTSLINPGAREAREADLMRFNTENAAQFENAARNRLQDMGAFSGGGSGRDVSAQLSALSGEMMRRGGMEAKDQVEREWLSRLGAAGDIGGRTTDIYRALEETPGLRLAGRLDQAANPAAGLLPDWLSQILAFQQGEALSNRGGSFFEQVSPLLGNLIGAGGNIGAAAAGRSSSDDLMEILRKIR